MILAKEALLILTASGGSHYPVILLKPDTKVVLKLFEATRCEKEASIATKQGSLRNVI